MSQPAKLPEPSIDEILASIRRSIVPDDESGKATARKSASRKPAAASAAASVPAPANANGHGGNGDATQTDATQARGDGPGWGDVDEQPGDPSEAEVEIEALSPDIGFADITEAGTDNIIPVPGGPLLSPRTTAAVDTAFHSLAYTVLSQNPRTLEDVVREMLKPMLKAWLDANLPDMVERLVRAEIERVSRRG